VAERNALMEYRALGKTGLEVSAVSLGTEYLIDLPRRRVVGVIREAVRSGVNYFDLFFAQGEFRDNMGTAFRGLRNRVILTVHLGSIDKDGQYAKTRDVKLARAFFDDALRRYGVECFDVVYVHNSDGTKDYREVTRRGGLLDVARRLVREGKARFVGFSSHTVETALAAVKSGRVDVLMFPINLAGNAVPGKKGLFRTCAARGVGLVAMKPYAGGKLFEKARSLKLDRWHLGAEPMTIKRRGRCSPPAGPPDGGRVPHEFAITPARCLAYALSQPGVSTVVPGCKDKKELAAALSYLDAGKDRRDFSGLVAAFSTYVEGECVYCNHCLPCPAGIDIAATIRAIETAKVRGARAGGGTRRSSRSGAKMTAILSPGRAPGNAAKCIRCGACVKRCPFGVNPMERIAQDTMPPTRLP
jgi:hypothetical protein